MFEPLALHLFSQRRQGRLSATGLICARACRRNAAATGGRVPDADCPILSSGRIGFAGGRPLAPLDCVGKWWVARRGSFGRRADPAAHAADAAQEALRDPVQGRGHRSSRSARKLPQHLGIHDRAGKDRRAVCLGPVARRRPARAVGDGLTIVRRATRGGGPGSSDRVLPPIRSSSTSSAASRCGVDLDGRLVWREGEFLRPVARHRVTGRNE